MLGVCKVLKTAKWLFDFIDGLICWISWQRIVNKIQGAQKTRTVDVFFIGRSPVSLITQTCDALLSLNLALVVYSKFITLANYVLAQQNLLFTLPKLFL